MTTTKRKIDINDIRPELLRLGEEFDTMSGVRIMAAAHHLLDLDEHLHEHDAGESEAPYMLRMFCGDTLTDELSLEGLDQGYDIPWFRGYVTLHNVYGDRWASRALADYYREVSPRDDWEIAATNRVRDAKKLFEQVLEMIENKQAEWIRVERELSEEANQLIAPKMKAASATHCARRDEAIRELVGACT